MNLIRIFLFSLLAMAGVANSAAVHFGAGVGLYDDEYIYYNDKAYYEDFSANLGVYSDFDKSHMFLLDIHLFTELTTVSEVTPFIYAGVGGIYIKDSDNYTHDKSSNDVEENWGVRFPIGLELMTPSNISLYVEVTPTYILSPNDEYETANAFGIRYYFY